MNPTPMTPAIIVKKGGFLSALAYGFFGFLSVCVISAAGIGVVALRSGDRVIEMVSSVATHPERFRSVMPSALAELFCDRRAPEYRDHLKIDATLRSAKHNGRGTEAIITVHNDGPETVSLLGLNVVVQDRDGAPVDEIRSYAATPFMVDHGDWRGPLAPGATRKFVRWVSSDRANDLDVDTEVVELRVLDTAKITEDRKQLAPAVTEATRAIAP